MLSHPAVEVVVKVTVLPTSKAASAEPLGVEISTVPAVTLTGVVVSPENSSEVVVLMVVGLVAPLT
jgi:hypothetical protein